MPSDGKTPSDTSKDAQGRLLTALMAIGIIALAFSVILPSLRSERELRCPRRINQIGSALLLYSHENGNRYPPTLAALALGPDALQPELVGCETSATVGFDSYVYLGRGMTGDESGDTVVLYDPNHEEGMYALYGDGHITFLDRIESDHVITELKAGHNPPRPRVLSASGPTTQSAGDRSTLPIQSPSPIEAGVSAP